MSRGRRDVRRSFTTLLVLGSMMMRLLVRSLPIRFSPTPPTCRVLPSSRVKLRVGRCSDVAGYTEQPGEAEMDDWQILLGDLRIAPFSDGEVFVAALGEAGVAAPVVGDERRAWHNGALDEATERLCAAVRHDGKPNPTGIATTLPLVELGTRLALANFHSAGDKNLIVDTTAFAARPAADPGFIDFNVRAGPAADPVLIRAHHPRAEFVENLERRLVARQAELSLKLNGRHAGCLAGHQIGRPKPYAQRSV